MILDIAVIQDRTVTVPLISPAHHGRGVGVSLHCRQSGDALEIWPESGVSQPVAILGVNKRSEG